MQITNVNFALGGMNVQTWDIPNPPRYYLWAWGDNRNGQLGLGNTTNYSSPVQVGSLTNWLKVSSRYFGTLAIKTDGTLWGMATPGAQYASPVQIGSSTSWSQISTGFSHNLAVQSDGTLWAWGNNSYGKLGLGNTTYYSSPKQVGALTNWASVESAPGPGTSAAIKTDGTLWTWGDNSYGALGLGNTTNRNSPVQVGALTNWASVSSGNRYSSAIKTDGTLWTWGKNYGGALGLNNGDHYSSPKQVGALTSWSKISSHRFHTLAIKTDGTLWAWGLQENGMVLLGLGDTNTRYSPVQVGALTNWAIPSAGQLSSAAIKTDGTLWTWGKNNLGQLGLGNTTSISSPVQVGSSTGWTSISTAYGNNVAIIQV